MCRYCFLIILKTPVAVFKSTNKKTSSMCNRKVRELCLCRSLDPCRVPCWESCQTTAWKLNFTDSEIQSSFHRLFQNEDEIWPQLCMCHLIWKSDFTPSWNSTSFYLVYLEGKFVILLYFTFFFLTDFCVFLHICKEKHSSKDNLNFAVILSF